MKILVFNGGSSSQKSCLYDIGETLPDSPPHPLWEGQIDWGISPAQIIIKTGGSKPMTLPAPRDRRQALEELIFTLIHGDQPILNSLNEIHRVGHRVVHGGSRYQQSTLITPQVEAEIERLIPLAPNHHPSHLEGIATVRQILGDIPQIAVFDTAFHAQIPDFLATYPIPYQWFEQGIRRYGFHGISHQYCAHRAVYLLRRESHELRIINCHLGNGASLAAIQNGISINTTMGFTPLEGLMMGTRCGSIDPSILIYLLKNQNVNIDELNTLLFHESGLKGIWGKSGDMREIIASWNGGDKRAGLALEMYIERLKSAIGSMAATLGGLDCLVFTAGVGENSAFVRERTCDGLRFLGIKLDRTLNENATWDSDIATPDSRVRILVIHTQEDWQIATECWLHNGSSLRRL